MPSLAELTDYYGERSTDLPVEPMYLPNINTDNVQLSTGENIPTRITVRPEPRSEPMPAFNDLNTSIGNKLDNILNKLTGKERYQLWPEKVVREGLSAAGDIMREGTVLPGLRREDITDIPKPDMPTKDSTWLGKLLALAPVAAQPGDSLIERAQAISALAGTGGLAGVTDATLGATPFLRPALKYKDRLYKGKEGQQHQDIIPKELYPEFERMAMSGEDISHYNFGFVNEKGHFLNREKALEHAINNGLLDPHAGQYGALTSTLMADSSKPGMAIEAMSKTAQPFYSALEHNLTSIQRNKMTGDQWLGTFNNKPGVKPEEMKWTGLQEFLQSKGKASVTKAQIEEHLANNKVELKEVKKGSENLNIAQKELEGAIGDGISWGKGKLYSDEIIRGLINEDLSIKDLPANLHGLAENLLKANKESIPTKYNSYQLPGGENYREMLLTLPDKGQKFTAKELAEQYGRDWSDVAPYERQQYENAANHTSKDVYRSSHWDEPNILAHVRMNDRTIDGKKSLHLEEIQSDWHQQGRDRGYAGNAKISEEEINKLAKQTAENRGIVWNSLNEQQKQSYIRSAQRDLDKAAVPDAPFKKSWHELALKRMIREAAEKGYDRLSWTPGEAQAARYDLSKQVDRIEYNPTTGDLRASKGRESPIKQNVTPEKLSAFIGKEAAKKILENPNEKMEVAKGHIHVLEGDSLKVGGEGMKGFYDQIIPKALEKIGKEHGVKVKSHMLETNPKGWHITQPSETVSNKWMVKSNDYNSKGFQFATKEEAEANLAQNIAGERAAKPIHYIDIPQSLKDHAMHKGFPLFSKGGHMLMPVDHEPDFGDK